MAPLTAPARHNLPRPGTGFVGRERDLSDLLRLLDTRRSVSLCGSEGIGKTRLALRVAEQATVSFPDGVWFAELGDASCASEVYVRIAEAVGVIEEPGRPLSATVLAALRPRRLLLVLDPCDRAADEVAGVCETLLEACPGVALLLTGREPVHLTGGTVWRVPPMAMPVAARGAPPPDPAGAEAVRLFMDRARARDPRFSVSSHEWETVAELCDLVGGVPMGIEVLGASAPGMGLDALAAGLREHLASPTARPGPGQAVARSDVLPLVLGFVHKDLTGPERALLARLSVFRGWDLELAEQVCADSEVPEADILDLLSSLLNRCLVTVCGEVEGRVRYRLTGAVLRFAQGLLSARGEEAGFHERLRDRMLRLVEGLSRQVGVSESMPWVDRDFDRQRIRTEYETLRSVLHRVHGQGAIEAGLSLCVGLTPHWVSYHSAFEGELWMGRFMEPDEAAKAPSWAQALVCRAQLARVRRDDDRALELGERGLRLSREAGDDVFVRVCLNMLALVEVRTRSRDRAAVRVEEALRLCRDSGDLFGEAIALGTRAALVAQQGDLTGADQYFNAALTLLRGMDHRWGVGVILMGQAVAAEAGGDLVTADRSFREALDTQRVIGSVPDEARCLAGIGRVAHAQGRSEQAYDYLSEGLGLSHAAGQRADAARALTAIARVAFDGGEKERACRIAGAAAAVREQLGRDPERAPWPFGDAERLRRRKRQLIGWWERGREMELAEAVQEAERLAEEGNGHGPARGKGASRGTRGARSGASGAAPASADGAQPSLTRREWEIARLVSAGKSNPEIARALFITPSTAARHVANINRKMGFNSRSQITDWVERNGTAS
ncbi:LuxR C-terminal-related transcriptional regulator [Nocardiopsis sp. LOL_012]|uniref:LuxR C-terminal-related transcriptional regulator n=1 Tax=Nocardiopsis sp. LOL_012 TaxID=3345409 RepID=UPI003A8458F5